MSYTVGLDFGTHQTKICIEDASNPAQKVYEFLEFNNLKNNNTFLLPSIVQINQDDRITYGVADETKCKVLANNSPEPILILPDEPVLELPDCPELILHPKKPKKPELRGFSIKEQLLLNKEHEVNIENWKNICRDVDITNAKIIQEWEIDCQGIHNDYNYDYDEFLNLCKVKKTEFEQEHKLWIVKSKPQKQIFRYFKLATFTNQKWSFNIKPEVISCWYLTYLLFEIEEKIGKNFFTQMGVPFSIKPFESVTQERIALQLLITANKLVEDYGSLNCFKQAKYHELLEKTNFSNINEVDINQYGINVLPEAFAGLTSITQQGKLSRGMHLLGDIGGGTTDIAFFTITEHKLPNIHAVLSMPIGLNFIFEMFLEKNKGYEIEQLQSGFKKSRNGFEDSIETYHSKLKSIANQMISNIETEFNRRWSHHRIEISRLRDALEMRPIVYCGGGSMYDLMRVPLHYFSDVRLINSDMLSIPYLKNTNINVEIFPILATSYGLSIPLEHEITMTPIEEVFAPLQSHEKDSDDNISDYYLSDD